MKRKPTKRICALLLALAMMLTLLPAALAAGRFTDVPDKAWYAVDVAYAVENGLVNGTSATTYSPDLNLSYAEAVKLAACMHKKVTTGSIDFAAGTPWYQPYADYAKAKGIIAGDCAWNAPVTRAGYMEIFANAIPSAGLKDSKLALTAMNRVDDNTIPDVSASHPQAEAIYKLYRAGIVLGNDDAHNCSPSSAIKRSEVAAILTRMMDPTKRIRFEMAGTGELKITKQPASSVSVKAGEKAQLSVSVTGGTGKRTFKWRRSLDGKNWEDVKDGKQYSGSDTQTLTVEANEETADYTYKCWVGDLAGKYAESSVSQFVISSPKLTVTKQPQDVSAVKDEWISFTVEVNGGKAPYTYRWESRDDQSNFTALPLNNPAYVKNADTATLNLRADANDWNYNFEYRCKITDALGSSVYSDSASIHEKENLRVTAQPSDCTPAGSGKAAFTVKVGGGKAPYRYRWTCSMDPSLSGDWISCDQKEFTELSGALTDRLTVGVDEATILMVYRCEITDAEGNRVNSSPARISLSSADVFAKNPQEIQYITSLASTSVTLQDWCLNALPSYQWQYRKPEDSEWQDCTNRDYMGMDTAKLNYRDSSDRYGKRQKSGYSFRCAVTLWGATVVYSDAVTEK